MKQKQQELADATKTLHHMLASEYRSLDAAETMQSDTPAYSKTRETQKTTASKPLLPQKKQIRNLQLQQINILYGPQGEKFKAEKRSQQIGRNTSELRKREHKSKNCRTREFGGRYEKFAEASH